MAEERKPKIDLKARLGKTATPPPVGVTPVGAPPGGGAPVPIPVPRQSAPPGVPVGPPPSFGSQPPKIDPTNPLAAVAVPYRPPPTAAPAYAAPAQPQRIEVDEMAVQQASRSALKRGVVIGGILALVLGGIGWVAGGASQQSSDRVKSHNDAKELSDDVGKARDALKSLADKVEGGIKTLHDDRKFPETLSTELGGINVDFDGSKLAGRRFSGFPAETAHDLVEFITAIQAINDRKGLIEGLLTQLKKPITEQLSIPAGQVNVSYVLAVDKDPSGNLAGFLSPLVAPIPVTKENINLPPKFTFAKPGGGGNADAPRYTGGDIARNPAAIYVVPKTFEAACPTAKSGQITQLAAQMGNFVHDIRGDKAPTDQDVVQDPKPGLLERAEKLITQLNKIN
jgi:hypothetical protein